MKSYLLPLLFAFFVFAIPQKTEAQFLKKLQKSVEGKIEREADRRAQKRTDKAIDDAFDKAEDAIDGNSSDKKKKSDSETNTNNKSNEGSNDSTDDSSKSNKTHQPKVVWSKFDFIPGDTVIFEDSPSVDEENGEFPSRWDLYKGNAEIGNVDGDNVIMFLQGGYIVPYLKDSDKDYLPEIFTIEFDVYFKEDGPGRYWMHFSDHKNQSRLYPPLEIYVNGLELGDSNKRYPDTNDLNWNQNLEGKWRHISVAFTKGKLKAYMDDTRLINIPHFEDEPTGITIQAENNSVNEKYLKNIRIAKGGVK